MRYFTASVITEDSYNFKNCPNQLEATYPGCGCCEGSDFYDKTDPKHVESVKEFLAELQEQMDLIKEWLGE